MSNRTIIIGILAILCGGSAALTVSLLYSQGNGGPSAELVPVIVAARDIPRGTLVTADLIKTQEIAKDLVPEGTPSTTAAVLDRVAFHSFVKGEWLLEQKLSAKHAKGGLAALVPKGMRAFTIQTPHVATHVAGFILPGNHVDILLTMSGTNAPGDVTGGGVTTTLLQGVEILAVDQRLEAPSENKVDPNKLQSVTVLVTPDQAAKLDLGQNKGTLHLSLRNPEDNAAAQTRPATLSGLQFHQEKPLGDQIKEVIEAIGKMQSQKTPKQTAAARDNSLDAPPPALEIRTLRGTHSGSVQLESLSPPTGGK